MEEYDDCLSSAFHKEKRVFKRDQKDLKSWPVDFKDVLIIVNAINIFNCKMNIIICN